MDAYREALARFDDLLEAARSSELNEPTAMTLATVDAEGRPSCRVVLLKGADARGFSFFTNVTSRKGEQLAGNPHAALCFFWDPLMEQVRVEGVVEPVSEAEADEYWESRHRESQVSAWASRQSAELDHRATLEARVARRHERFADAPIPRPEFWSGYRLVPERIEFWRSLPHRLHERVCYTREDGEWRVCLLYP
ncbi:MAG: pyridoxamine 5'-phosphate oxidase [Gammaproteobacteria bacterium]|nr:pyridoxamine 5'-phosphate oxidase [Gammaproteobacteria bacterium]